MRASVATTVQSWIPNSYWDRLSFILLIAAALIGFCTFDDYGLSWDYIFHDTYGKEVISFYTSWGADRIALEVGHHPYVLPMRIFGGGFEIFVNLLRTVLPGNEIEKKALATFLFALLGVAGAMLSGRIIAGPRAGFFAGLFLLIYPCYYGHSYINHKDLPVAVTYCLFVTALLHSVKGLHERRVRSVLILGLATGCLLSIRVGMLFALALIPLAWLMASFARRGSLSFSLEWFLGDLKVSAVCFLGVLMLGWGVMCLLWPYALIHPIQAPIDALSAFSSFPWNLPMLFEGGYYYPKEVPWHYLPTWTLLQIPEYLLLALLLSVFAFVSSLPNLRTIFLVKVLVLLSAIMLPIVGIIFTGAVVYDAARHILFELPLLSVLGAVGFSVWLQQINTASPTMAAQLGVNLMGMLIFWNVFAMVSLHPYQYIFVNTLIGGGVERASQRYESDYWATCMKEAVNWVFATQPSVPDRPTLIAGFADDIQIKHQVEVMAPHRADFGFTPVESEADIYITTSRFKGHIRNQDKLIHTISREGANLCYIFRRQK